jgi:hypothetical protein
VALACLRDTAPSSIADSHIFTPCIERDYDERQLKAGIPLEKASSQMSAISLKLKYPEQISPMPIFRGSLKSTFIYRADRAEGKGDPGIQFCKFMN